jgi:hypothetical protein
MRAWARQSLSVWLTIPILVAACGATPSPPATPSPQVVPSPQADPNPQAVPSLPYSLAFPKGWEVGGGGDIAAIMAELEELDSEWARRTREVVDRSATVENQLVAYDFSSEDEWPPNVSCNTVDRGQASDATILDQGQQQNLEAIAHLPGITAGPTAEVAAPRSATCSPAARSRSPACSRPLRTRSPATSPSGRRSSARSS